MKDNKLFPILDILKIGQENAISRDELAIFLKCTPREVSAEVQRERNNGAIIISGSGKGYWLPEGIDDYKLFIGVQNARINSMSKMVSGAISVLNALTQANEGGEE